MQTIVSYNVHIFFLPILYLHYNILARRESLVHVFLIFYMAKCILHFCCILKLNICSRRSPVQFFELMLKIVSHLSSLSLILRRMCLSFLNTYQDAAEIYSLTCCQSQYENLPSIKSDIIKFCKNAKQLTFLTTWFQFLKI